MSSNKQLELDDGRTVSVASDSDGQTVEIRAEGGDVELCIKITPEGPVLQLQGVKVQINASESIEMKTKKFSVEASESMELGTEGEMTIQSTADMIVKGKVIWLN